MFLSYFVSRVMKRYTFCLLSHESLLYLFNSFLAKKPPLFPYPFCPIRSEAGQVGRFILSEHALSLSILDVLIILNFSRFEEGIIWTTFVSSFFQETQQYNESIDAVAEKYSIPIIPVYAVLKDPNGEDNPDDKRIPGRWHAPKFSGRCCYCRPISGIRV